jgi:hypothetical protein
LATPLTPPLAQLAIIAPDISGDSLTKRLQCPTPSFEERNGRRHEVDFGDAGVRVEIDSSEETVEIFIEADFGNPPGGTSALRHS